jgi:hypothetical protein
MQTFLPSRKQVRFPGGHPSRQRPSWQVTSPPSSLVEHTFPQEPQFVRSLFRSTHVRPPFTRHSPAPGARQRASQRPCEQATVIVVRSTPFVQSCGGLPQQVVSLRVSLQFPAASWQAKPGLQVN